MDALLVGTLYLFGSLLALTAFADKILGHFEKAQKVVGWLYRSGGRRRKMHRILTSPGGRLALLVVALVIIFSSRQIQISNAGPSRAELKKQFESNLMLVEAYPHYQWKLTGRTTGSYPLDGTTLSASLNDGIDDRLTLMIVNGNDGIPLSDAEIFVFFSSEIRLTTRPQMWRPLDSSQGRQGWWAKLPGNGTVPGSKDGGAYGINESLMTEFPRPDVYPISWRISGTALGSSVERAGTFWARLVVTP